MLLKLHNDLIQKNNILLNISNACETNIEALFLPTNKKYEKSIISRKDVVLMRKIRHFNDVTSRYYEKICI